MQKRIDYILEGRNIDVSPEVKVSEPLEHKDLGFINPFVSLRHFGPEFVDPGSEFRIDPHPYRGFAQISFQVEGETFHKDSLGSEAICVGGDVQVMFAGRGVVHSEGPTPELSENGGRQEVVQVWVNVPAECKWDDPYYQKFDSRKQPILFDQSGVKMRLSIGTYEGRTGPVEMYTPMIGIIGEMELGKRIQLSAKPGWWTMIYVISGSINVCFETITDYHLIVFEKGNDEIIVTSEENTHILYLSGEPLDEPVFVKDNFVMATAAEVEQAIEDAKNGKFGTLGG